MLFALSLCRVMLAISGTRPQTGICCMVDTIVIVVEREQYNETGDEVQEIDGIVDLLSRRNEEFAEGSDIRRKRQVSDSPHLRDTLAAPLS